VVIDGGEPTVDDGYKWWAFTAIAISFVTMVMSMSMVFVALSAIAALGPGVGAVFGGGGHGHVPERPGLGATGDPGRGERAERAIEEPLLVAQGDADGLVLEGCHAWLGPARRCGTGLPGRAVCPSVPFDATTSTAVQLAPSQPRTECEQGDTDEQDPQHALEHRADAEDEGQDDEDHDEGHGPPVPRDATTRPRGRPPRGGA
jgi:hypothetical protein